MPTTPSSPPADPVGSDPLLLVAGRWDAQGRCRTPVGDLDVRVADAIPGEELRVRVVGRSQGARVAWAEVAEVVAPAPLGPARREPPCPLHGVCGACGLQHAAEEGRLRARVTSALPAFPEDLASALAPEDRWIAGAPFGYRHKALLLPWLGRDGHLRLGGFARGTHEVIDLPNCAVLAPSLAAVDERLRALLTPIFQAGTLVPLPPGTSAGPRAGLRAVVLRGNREGQVLVTFVVVGRKASKHLRPLGARLVKEDGPVVGVFMQEHDGRGDAVVGKRRAKLLAGKRTIAESVDGRPVTITPLGFFQVNPEVLEALALRVRDLAGEADAVIDLYCGGGVLGLAAARGRAPLLGVDVAEESVEGARTDAAAWGVDATFRVGPPSEVLPGAEVPAGRRVVLLDPPRSGCREEDLAAALALRPEVLVYVSCSATSLGRDAIAVSAAGLRPRTLVPADMLPQTPHLEWIAVWEQ